MKKFLFFMALSATTLTSNAQFMADFELPLLATDSSWFGQDQVIDGDTIYTDFDLHFELNYNSGWGSFTGWSVSNYTDVATPGYGNQFSAITGTGNNSSQYGVCYASTWGNNRIFLDNTLANNYFWESVKITNTTFAYQSMLNGDSFAKPFGADTSAAGVNDGTNGEDWFLLTIYALGNDTLRNGDSINYYLADYRFANPADDYIINTWENIDLTPLTFIPGLAPIGLDFVLTSSDTSGGAGMNTPSYFAIDDLLIDALGNINEVDNSSLTVYPNPINSEVNILTEPYTLLRLYDMNGRLIKQERTNNTQVIWDLSFLDAGIYNLVSSNGSTSSQAKVIKQ